MTPAIDQTTGHSVFLWVLPTADDLAEAVAGDWLDKVAAARGLGRPFLVALSGGRLTPRLFAAVVAQKRARGISFEHLHFFWADERCVPPTDTESNFRMANENLFSPLNISASQIHRLKGEAAPESAAADASAELLSLAPANAAGEPVLDLVLLGMGEDGHVASLFPGADEKTVNCSSPFLVVRHSPKPPPIRLSMSYSIIAAAGQVWVLITGAGKGKVLHDSLFLRSRTPLGRVVALHPGVRIFTDLTISIDPSTPPFEIRS